MLASVIIGGAAEELALERLMAAARKELEEGARTGAVSLDDEVACKAYLSEQIKAKGFRSKQLTRNGKSLERHSEEAKEWSKCASLSEVREKTAGISAATASTSVRRRSSPSASTRMAFYAPMMSRAPMRMPMAVESDAWACKEAEVSEEQCERLYSKIRSRA